MTVLKHLQLPSQPPSRDFLDSLLAAWSSRIPWESASRIARHQEAGAPETYAYLPEKFLESAIQYGTGGTCFESNFAFHHLLSKLGFESTLHFCDMETTITDPHCAVVVKLDGQPYIADVGYPIPKTLHLDAAKSTHIDTSVYQFTAIPLSKNRWEVRRKAENYEGLSFILKGTPIAPDTFKQRLLLDHTPHGLFLQEVILQRTDSNGMLRYSESKGLVKRDPSGEYPISLSSQEQANLPHTLASLFNFDETILQKALHRQVQ